MELEVVTGSYDSLVQGFSIDALEPESKGLQRKFHEKDHSGCVRAVSCGGRYLATGSTDETIKLYDMRRHTEIGTLHQQEGSITWLTFHKDRLLLSASEDGTICVWKCGEAWNALCTLTGHKYSVTCVSVHPSGKLALSVGKDRTVRTWDLTNFRSAFRLRLPIAADLVLWSPIGDQYVLSVGKDISVYDVSTGESMVAFDVGRQVNCFTFIQDTVLAVGSDHSHIDLFSTTCGSLLASLKGHTNRVKGLALSPAADLLFSASSDGTVKAWRLKDPLSDSHCVSSIDTGSRLTCLTVVAPDSLLREMKKSSQAITADEDEVQLDKEETSRESEVSQEKTRKKALKMRRGEERKEESSKTVSHDLKKNRLSNDEGVTKSVHKRTLRSSGGRKQRQKEILKRKLAYRKTLLMRKKHLQKQN